MILVKTVKKEEKLYMYIYMFTVFWLDRNLVSQVILVASGWRWCSLTSKVWWQQICQNRWNAFVQTWGRAL